VSADLWVAAAVSAAGVALLAVAARNKARLAKAEQALVDKADERCDALAQQMARAEAAERERDETEARCKEEKGRRQAAEADLRKTEEHRLAAVAESVRYERKCAELSEAIGVFFHHWEHGGIARDNRFHQETAAALKRALASQPAPEAKPVEEAYVHSDNCAITLNARHECSCKPAREAKPPAPSKPRPTGPDYYDKPTPEAP
jgi:hypothetical protein